MVEESGTLESQLEATKVSSLSVSGPAKTLHPTTASRRTWLQVGYKVGWPGTPLSLGLKQPRTSVILKEFFVFDNCYQELYWERRRLLWSSVYTVSLAGQPTDL